MGPQPGPRLLEVQTRGGVGGRLPVGSTLPIGTPQTGSSSPHSSLPASPASPASSRCPGCLPASGCPLQGGPWALPWPHVAMGTEAPPRSRCAPPPRPHPDMGNKVQRRQKNDTQAYEGWHGARCGPWPTEPEPCLPGVPTLPLFRMGATPA